MLRILLLLYFGIYLAAAASSQDLPLLKISEDKHFLVTGENEPFLWLGGTAWELLHRLDREEALVYLKDRADKGFTVIQTVILAELNGLHEPNAYGQVPLIDDDPARLNEKYFEQVDYIIREAEQLGLYIGLLPTWGDKFNKKWGTGPEIFTPENARIFGRLLGERYRSDNNIIWVLGGDRIPEQDEHYEIIRAMAIGIRMEDNQHLMTYHPVGAQTASSYFNDDWLDIDMFQSGHSRVAKEYQFVVDSRKVIPKRPVINGESRYENIPDRFWEKDSYDIWLDDSDVRISAYWSMIAGAAGYTYGCNDIWQMYEHHREPVIAARTGWNNALELPGSTHMKYLKLLFKSIPWQDLVYDQSVILNENLEDESYMVAALSQQNDFLMVYTPAGKTVKPDLTRFNTSSLLAFWYNPRNGRSVKIGEFSSSEPHEFTPWSNGRGSDFVLIVMDKKARYKLPGINN